MNLIAIYDDGFELRRINYVPSEVEQPWKVDTNGKKYCWSDKANRTGCIYKERAEKLLAIRSIFENTEGMEERADAFLDLAPYFKEKHLIEEYSWNEINEELTTFFSRYASVRKRCIFHLKEKSRWGH